LNPGSNKKDQFKDKIISSLIANGFDVKYYSDVDHIVAKREDYEISMALYPNYVVISKLIYNHNNNIVKYDGHNHELEIKLPTILGRFEIYWNNDNVYGEISYEELELLLEMPVEFAIQFVGERLPLSARFIDSLRAFNGDRYVTIRAKQQR